MTGLPSTALPRLAKLASVVFVVYALAMRLATGSNLPATIFSPGGVLIAGAAGLLVTASAVTFLFPLKNLEESPLAPRVARALVWVGLAFCLAGIPPSLAFREMHAFMAGEGQTIPQNYRGNLPELRFGKVVIAPRGSHFLLSKRVDIETSYMTLMGVKSARVGLFPAARVGAWRLSINKFGYAPVMDLKDSEGNSVVYSRIMLGTFLHTKEEENLVDWTPFPNLMLGVGYYPPKIEDLINVPGGVYRVFVRIEEAAIGGKRRNLLRPDAYRFMADGRLEDPIYRVRVFRRAEKIFDGRLKPEETAEFPGGGVKLSREVLIWVEILAARDRWLGLVTAGPFLIAAGLLLFMVCGRGARKNKSSGAVTTERNLK